MINEEKEYFLLHKYCKDAYEEAEMKKWIKEKGLDHVYHIVIDMFYGEDFVDDLGNVIVKK